MEGRRGILVKFKMETYSLLKSGFPDPGLAWIFMSVVLPYDSHLIFALRILPVTYTENIKPKKFTKSVS